MADLESDEGLRDADRSSVRTRSSVRRGFRGCTRCTAAPGTIDAEEVTAFANGGRLGEGCLGPPSF